MNKVFIGMVVAVCILGMALLMLSERVSKKTDRAEQTANTTAKTEIFDEVPKNTEQPVLPQENAEPISPQVSRQMAENAINLETGEARQALAPPIPAKEEISKLEPEVVPNIVQEIPPVIKEEPKQPDRAQNQPVPEPMPAPPVKQPVSSEKPVKSTPSGQDTPKHNPENIAPQKIKANTITKFVVFARDKGATIRLGGSSPLHYKSTLLENPDRLVIDLDGNWEFPSNMAIPKNELVNSVRVGKNEDKTRLVIDLKVKPRVLRMIPSKNSENLDARVDK